MPDYELQDAERQVRAAPSSNTGTARQHGDRRIRRVNPGILGETLGVEGVQASRLQRRGWTTSRRYNYPDSPSFQ